MLIDDPVAPEDVRLTEDPRLTKDPRLTDAFADHALGQPRRALILAGGGLKVAFQAGVLQVWLDEARTADDQPLVFGYGDGASGGCFNLAMWCQGLTGHEIAERWRRTQPMRGLALNLQRWSQVPTSLLGYAAFRKNVLRDGWGLDWAKINATTKHASFNLFNATQQRLTVRDPREMDEDALVSAVSLPMWFPPVRLGRSAGADQYIDAVYATDANLEAAIAAGANELWVVWTVSQRGDWRPGFVNEYFQIIEAAANARIRAVLDRIERNNALVEAKKAGADLPAGPEFGRHIEVKWLSAEVPAHYLLNFTQAAMREAVDRGVAQARVWCRHHGYLVRASDPPTAGGRIAFRERMDGDFLLATAGEDEATERVVAPRDRNARPAWGAQSLSLRLKVEIPDVDYFVYEPRHCARLTGEVDCPAFGGRRPITDGIVEVLPDEGDPAYKSLTYRLTFHDEVGDRPVTLIGRKYVTHEAGANDLWSDTTTLFVTLYRDKWVHGQPPDDARIGDGIVRLTLGDFVRELLSFRAGDNTGGSENGASSGPEALYTFGEFFLRQLWQVYAMGPQRRVLPQFYPPSAERSRTRAHLR
jgi:predicted acylesterase/phospholipase RssA